MFEVIAQGEGPLFMDPDADKARDFFQSKERALVNKLMPLKEAVKRFVHDGAYLAIGGFGANRTPTAACQEIVRQRKKDLIFCGHTATHDYQILAAGEVFNRCDAAYIIGLEIRGLSPNARRYSESGKVQFCEWTNYGLDLRLKGAAMGVCFLPGRNMMGTDTFKRSAAKIGRCPFTGKIHCLYPSLWPDISVIHVHEADVYGNSRFQGISVCDLELARASKRLIITCERLIHNKEIRNAPSATLIPYYLVDAVCEVPYGAYPGNMVGEYFSDENHLRLWLESEQNPETFKKFMNKYIYGTKDFDEYLELCGGMKRMRALRAEENLIELREEE
jgi:glutaconate CoA-transferase subunit A